MSGSRATRVVMRIWLAPSAYHPALGGVEHVTARLAQELVGRGHDVLVVTNQWPDGVPDVETVFDIPVRRLHFTQLGRHPKRWPQHLARSRAVRNGLEALTQPDVVHVHCVAGQAVPLARYCRRHRVRLVVTTHGETAMDEGRAYQRSVLRRNALRMTAWQASELTACSRWTRDHAASLAPAFARAHVVHNGVDVALWSGLPDISVPVFGAYGRHVPQKGFDILVAAFRLVQQRLPTAQLLLGGAGSQTELIRSAAGPGVTFLGRLDPDGVRQLLGAVRVVVVPSVIEPFGLVALEALAAGRRLVYSAVGGLQDLGHGQGWPAPAGDVSALAEAMYRAHVERQRGPTPGRLAEQYSWSAVCDEYLALY